MKLRSGIVAKGARVERLLLVFTCGVAVTAVLAGVSIGGGSDATAVLPQAPEASQIEALPPAVEGPRHGRRRTPYRRRLPEMRRTGAPRVRLGPPGFVTFDLTPEGVDFTWFLSVVERLTGKSVVMSEPPPKGGHPVIRTSMAHQVPNTKVAAFLQVLLFAHDYAMMEKGGTWTITRLSGACWRADRVGGSEPRSRGR